MKTIFTIIASLFSLTAVAQPWVLFIKNDKCGLMSHDSVVMLEPIYDYIATKTAYAAGGGSVLVRIADSCFIVNIKTKQTSLLVDLPRQHKHNLYAALIAAGDKYGYLDAKGRVVIDGQWDFASDFADGMARVVNGQGEVLSSITRPSPGKTGFIDTTGRYVIPMEYSYIDDFRGGSATRFTRGKYVCDDILGCENPYKGSKWGLIDNTGKIVVADDKYDFIDRSIWDEKSGKVIFGVTCGDLVGIIDDCGVEIVPLYKEESLKKMFEKYFSDTATVLLSLGVSAQKVEFDINGLILGNTYTNEQIIEKLGQPTKIFSWSGDFGGYGQEFYYGQSHVALDEDGEFTSFSIRSPRFKVLKGTVKVGDPISKITSTKGAKCTKPKYQVQFIAAFEDDVVFEVENGIITCIHGHVPN